MWRLGGTTHSRAQPHLRAAGALSQTLPSGTELRSASFSLRHFLCPVHYTASAIHFGSHRALPLQRCISHLQLAAKINFYRREPLRLASFPLHAPEELNGRMFMARVIGVQFLARYRTLTHSATCIRSCIVEAVCSM